MENPATQCLEYFKEKEKYSGADCGRSIEYGVENSPKIDVNVQTLKRNNKLILFAKDAFFVDFILFLLSLHLRALSI